MGTAKTTTTPFADHTTMDDVKAKAADIKATVEEKARFAASRVSDGLSNVGVRMQDKPLAALGIALGVGFILGRLMAR
jgi:ElaB/YqjD/DUF883 family membrane-anchored ribosome-binding protein